MFARFNSSELPAHLAASLSGSFALPIVVIAVRPTSTLQATFESNKLTPLTTGNAHERVPMASPDGKNIIYRQTTINWGVVSVSLEDGSAKTLITGGSIADTSFTLPVGTAITKRFNWRRTGNRGRRDHSRRRCCRGSKLGQSVRCRTKSLRALLETARFEGPRGQPHL